MWVKSEVFLMSLRSSQIRRIKLIKHTSAGKPLFFSPCFCLWWKPPTKKLIKNISFYSTPGRESFRREPCLLHSVLFELKSCLEPSNASHQLHLLSLNSIRTNINCNNPTCSCVQRAGAARPQHPTWLQRKNPMSIYKLLKGSCRRLQVFWVDRLVTR